MSVIHKEIAPLRCNCSLWRRNGDSKSAGTKAMAVAARGWRKEVGTIVEMEGTLSAVAGRTAENGCLQKYECDKDSEDMEH
jgi:hypothetical protein